MAALPRRTNCDKISCCAQAPYRNGTRFPLHSQNVSLYLLLENKEFACRVQSVVAKHNLFSAVLARRFVNPDTNGSRETCCEQNIERKRCMLLLCEQIFSDNGYKAACRVQNMVAIKLRNTKETKNPARRPRARRRYAASPEGLLSGGKAGNNRSGRACSSLAVFPAFHCALGPSCCRVPISYSGTLFEVNVNIVPQPRVQGDHPPGGVWGRAPGTPSQVHSFTASRSLKSREMHQRPAAPTRV